MDNYISYVDAIVLILDNADHGGETRLVPWTADSYELLGSSLNDEGYYITLDGVYVTKAVGDRLYREGYVGLDTP